MNWFYRVLIMIVAAALSAVVIYRDIKQSTPAHSIDKPTYIPTTHDTVFGGDFTLQQVREGHTSDHVKFSLENVRGKLVVLYFGYTYCPDICPLGLSHISQALGRLKRDRDKIVPIFVTVDPERDTPDVLKLYATNFDPAFIFLTGSPSAIEQVKKQYRVYAEKAWPDQKDSKKASSDRYVINHSSYIYILGTDGKFIQQIPHDMAVADMEKVFVTMLMQHIKRHNN